MLTQKLGEPLTMGSSFWVVEKRRLTLRKRQLQVKVANNKIAFLRCERKLRKARATLSRNQLKLKKLNQNEAAGQLRQIQRSTESSEIYSDTSRNRQNTEQEEEMMDWECADNIESAVDPLVTNDGNFTSKQEIFPVTFLSIF